MQVPNLSKPIPPQIINEQAAFAPFDLKVFFESEAKLQFEAGLADGSALPKGMICTADGILTGIPAKGTQGNYEVSIIAQNEAGETSATFVLTIKPTLSMPEGEYLDKLKSQVWQAVEQNLPIPDLSEMYTQPITPLEIYYLLERWGILTIWDAFNLEAPGDKVKLNLPGASKHYHVYDRGSCLIATPKDLYSHERTLEDGLQTARAMAQEVYGRQWTVELSGFDKLTRAAWVELNHLGDKFGKAVEIINYNATPSDVKIYRDEAVGIKYREGGA